MKLIAVPSVVETINKADHLPLTTDVKRRKIIVVSMDVTGESLKSHNITVKVLARRSNAMWNIMLTAT